MPADKIKLNEYYEGDSWSGMVVGPILINSAQPDNTLASVRMQFRSTEDPDTLGFELNTSGAVDGAIGLITIDDSATWEITVPSQILTDLEAGTYDWDFECTDSTGWVITTYVGTMKVKGDVTHD